MNEDQGKNIEEELKKIVQKGMEKLGKRPRRRRDYLGEQRKQSKLVKEVSAWVFHKNL